ncbi:MAG: pantetheine-phosphate adenylyltransferase [Firmicutes bacterium]|nr:pantetheine-phosphate adenylyltransferase [Clostridiales bacterium]MBQ9931265.1 pantetheine-phosphate adenylyltransferase [Bacillota bacterium]
MKRILYAGSFDPITNGHMDIINRAARLGETLVVGVIQNPSKKSFFSLEERKELARRCTAHLPNVEVDCFSGLLARYVKEHNIDTVVRGLRATMDFESEIQMAQMNARLYGEGVETIFLMTSPDYSFVSSSMVKEVFLLDGDINGLVPEPVLQGLNDKVKSGLGGDKK